jgi:hypothetical protein
MGRVSDGWTGAAGRIERGRSAALSTALGALFAFTQTACPGGAELEHPEAWAGRFSTGNATGSGGAGSSSAGAGTGTAGTGTNLVLDKSTIDCGTLDPEQVLARDCAKGGCHTGTFAAAGITLTFAKIAPQTKDVPAAHGGIGCPDDPLQECVPSTCPTDALLVNSTAPASSWLLAKVHGMENGCGDPMPSPNGYTTAQAANLACIDAIVEAIAKL